MAIFDSSFSPVISVLCHDNKAVAIYYFRQATNRKYHESPAKRGRFSASARQSWLLIASPTRRARCRFHARARADARAQYDEQEVSVITYLQGRSFSAISRFIIARRP